MGRRSHAKALRLWMNGEPVGRWRIDARGQDELVYDDAWLTSRQFRPLSLSLPAPVGGGALRSPAVVAYFDNLLPDSDTIRQRLQARFATPSTGAFDLLAAIGRDCVGALQLTPDDEAPPRVDVQELVPLDEAGVEAELRGAVATRAGPGDDEEPLRISIAGAQEKTALTRHDGRWCRPLETTPSTHIFKLPMGLVGHRQADMRTSVENEWLCAELLREFGLAVAACEIAQFGSQKALIVERFDRRFVDAGYWLRLPQEDFCQATGTPAVHKYEADGGPSLLAIARILQNSESRNEDLHTLLVSQLLFWLLAAPDGHAKNFSIHLLPGGRYRLTPLYDVLSGWPMVGRGPNQYPYEKLKLAMALRGKNVHYRMREIQRRHFVETARMCGFDEDMENLIDHVLAQAPQVVRSVGARLPTGFPEDVFAATTKGLLDSAQRLHR